MSTFNRAMVVIWSLFSAAAVAEADWVLRGGTVYSMDETATHYSAVAFSGNRLVWLGETEAADTLIGPDTQVIELAGRTVLPGFIDTHNYGWTRYPWLTVSNSVLMTAPSRCWKTLQSMLAPTPIKILCSALAFWPRLLVWGDRPQRS